LSLEPRPGRLFLAFAVASWPFVYGSAAAEIRQSDLIGHSIEAAWTDSVRYRRTDGSERNRDKVVRVILYIGAANHIFERETSQQISSNHHWQPGPRLKEDVEALGDSEGKTQWQFENDELIKMHRIRRGAHRMVIDFQGAGDAPTCSVSLIDLHKGEAGPIVTKSNRTGSILEILSHTISDVSCKVTKGNLLAGE